MNEVTLDIETQNTFADIGSNDTAQLLLSVVGVHTSDDNEYRTYTEEELPRLWPILEHASIIIGFNHKWFDMPVLNRYYAGDCTKFPLFDIMEEVQRIIGFRPRLDGLAQGTLGKGKSGHGLDAITYWKTGQIEKLKAYCLDDVRLTRALYDFGAREGYLLLHQRFGAPKKIAVDFARKAAAPTAVPLTLGF